MNADGRGSEECDGGRRGIAFLRYPSGQVPLALPMMTSSVTASPGEATLVPAPHKVLADVCQGVQVGSLPPQRGDRFPSLLLPSAPLRTGSISCGPTEAVAADATAALAAAASVQPGITPPTGNVAGIPRGSVPAGGRDHLVVDDLVVADLDPVAEGAARGFG